MDANYLVYFINSPPACLLLEKQIIIENELFSKALDLASLSTEYSQYKDWWWKVQIGKCYYR
jgi:tetratricopeptide repeat protein 8